MILVTPRVIFDYEKKISQFVLKSCVLLPLTKTQQHPDNNNDDDDEDYD